MILRKYRMPNRTVSLSTDNVVMIVGPGEDMAVPLKAVETIKGLKYTTMKVSRQALIDVLEELRDATTDTVEIGVPAIFGPLRVVLRDRAGYIAHRAGYIAPRLET